MEQFLSDTQEMKYFDTKKFHAQKYSMVNFS